jgi:hypothetical protein
MRIIGKSASWNEIELDPVKAYHRGRVLDAQLRAAIPAPAHGVTRGTLAEFQRADEARMREAARKLNRTKD